MYDTYVQTWGNSCVLYLLSKQVNLMVSAEELWQTRNKEPTIISGNGDRRRNLFSSDGVAILGLLLQLLNHLVIVQTKTSYR